MFIRVVSQLNGISVKFYNLWLSQTLFLQLQNTYSPPNPRLFLKDAGKEDLDWPPRSHDLSPIEHIWDDIDRTIIDPKESGLTANAYNRLGTAYNKKSSI